MSEFTAGNLTITKYKDRIEQSNPIYFAELNDKWLLFFTKETEVNDEVPIDILTTSEEIPILYFYNFEDHGWGYSIILKGQIISKFDLSYEFEDNLLIEIIEEDFPEADPHEFLYTNSEGEALREKLKKSENFNNSIKNLFIDCALDNFKLFELESDKIDQLKTIMNYEYINALESYFNLVDQFKDILQIKEMSWISSDHIEDLQD
ncbi:hypothetical protein P9222_25550 [Paenibacillus amylolyticus]|nr:hypothetical protein [Paenibacillus amylolyticus]WFR61718.1 hypothetical protein P9222_25550 [Paenibacillus amylolyticus]